MLSSHSNEDLPNQSIIFIKDYLADEIKKNERGGFRAHGEKVRVEFSFGKPEFKKPLGKCKV
jgi:hypothetical protein